MDGQTVRSPPADDLPRLYLDALGVEVTSLGELEAALKPRLDVTSQRYARFLTLDDATLAAAGVTTQRAVDFLQHTLLSIGNDVARVNDVLGEMPRNFFSEDHAWRLLFDEFRYMNARFSAFKLLALARYRGYLVGCLNALNRVSDDRLNATIGGELRTVSEQATEALGAIPAEDSMRSADLVVRDLVRLPDGVTVSIRPGLDGSIELWLGRRRYRIEKASGIALVDDRGQRIALREGRNVVGRRLSNDVVVHSECRDVSRRHLIVDVRDGAPVALTDLSSSGTFISRARLGPHQSPALRIV